MKNNTPPEGGPDFERLLRENTNLWFILALLAVGSISVGIAWYGSKDLNDVLLGMGTGVFASAAVVWGYGIYAERRANVVIAAACTDAAMAQTKAYLATHFFRSIPIETYDKTSAPTEKFCRDFAPRLVKSAEYIHRGADAGFAVFRLTELINHRCILDKQSIQLQLLDPRAEALLEQRVRIEFESNKTTYSPQDVAKKVADLKLDIYVSLYSAFCICHVRPITVVFHRDNPFYRAEILGDVAFISFYLGGEYPGTFLFGSDSHIYRAFRRSLDITLAAPAGRIDLNQATKHADFIDFLRSLEFAGEVADLEQGRQSRFQKHRARLPFSSSEPF